MALSASKIVTKNTTMRTRRTNQRQMRKTMRAITSKKNAVTFTNKTPTGKPCRRKTTVQIPLTTARILKRSRLSTILNLILRILNSSILLQRICRKHCKTNCRTCWLTCTMAKTTLSLLTFMPRLLSCFRLKSRTMTSWSRMDTRLKSHSTRVNCSNNSISVSTKLWGVSKPSWLTTLDRIIWSLKNVKKLIRSRTRLQLPKNLKVWRCLNNPST